MPIPDLGNIEAALRLRGFRRNDAQYHECAKCGVRAVAIYAISGRVGGRQIFLCFDCGDTKSWRSAAGGETREEDKTFDLKRFLAG